MTKIPTNYLYTIIFVLGIVIFLFLLSGCYNYLGYIENFEESSTKSALLSPTLNKWMCPITADSWFTVIQNGYRIKIKDMKTSENVSIAPYENMSISFLLKLTSTSPNWRNVFHFSNDDRDWGGEGSRNPSLWIYPDNKTNLHIRIGTNSSNNDGRDTNVQMPIVPTRENPILVTFVITKTNMKLFLDSTQIYSHNLNNTKPRTGETTFYLGDPWYNQNGGIQIKNFTVYDGVLTAEDINKMNDILTPAGTPGTPGARGFVGVPGTTGTPGPSGEIYTADQTPISG